MENTPRENLSSGNLPIKEDDTIISAQPPHFEPIVEPAQVQPVVPIAQAPSERFETVSQQPQVVYVAQPATTVQTEQPQRSWGWIPAALVLLLVATVAGAFVGAELYKRSAATETAPAAGEPNVEDFLKNENKSAKKTEKVEVESKSEQTAKTSETLQSIAAEKPLAPESTFLETQAAVERAVSKPESKVASAKRGSINPNKPQKAEEGETEESADEPSENDDQAAEKNEAAPQPIEIPKPDEQKPQNPAPKEQKPETEKPQNPDSNQKKPAVKMPEKVPNEKDVNQQPTPQL